MRTRSVVLGTIAGLLGLAPAVTAQTLVSPKSSGAFRLGTAPDTGRGLALLSREGRNASSRTFELHARPLDRRGRPTGTESQLTPDFTPSLSYIGAEQVGFAADTRRDRYLVAWSAYEPGMASEPCDPGPSLSPFVPNECRMVDLEIFVRVVGADGRPLSPARRVTATGPADQTAFKAFTPTIAYDRRNDRYLLVFAAATRGDSQRGELFAQRLEPDGTPQGTPRRMNLRPGADSAAPIARLAANPAGGFMLAFGWGQGFDKRELYAAALTPSGGSKGAHAISAPGGAGISGLEVAIDPNERSALLLFSDFIPRASRGTGARRVGFDGRPDGPRVPLSYDGPVVASPDTDGAGWLYAFVEDGSGGNRRRVKVQRATGRGRPIGEERFVTPAEGHASEPSLAPLRGGRHVLEWTETPNGPDAHNRPYVRTL